MYLLANSYPRKFAEFSIPLDPKSGRESPTSSLNEEDESKLDSSVEGAPVLLSVCVSCA